MLKKILALFCASVVFMSAAACGGDSGSSGGGDASGSSREDAGSGEKDSSADESGESTDKTAANEDAVVLRIYTPAGGEAPMSAGLQDDAIAKKIEEDVGVILDIEITDENKTQAMVASGDLFDLNLVGKVEYIDPLIKVGSIAAFDDYMELAPDITENFGELISFSKDFLSGGTDQIYVLPARAKEEATPVYPAQDGNFIRWDYYEEIGAPEINNVDDLVDVLDQIVKNHPTTEDGKQVYATCTFMDWGLGTGFKGSALKKYHGNSSNVPGPFDSYSLADMSYQDMYSDDNTTWLTCEFYNKLNQRGIFDPESFSHKYENVMQKINEGRYVTMPAEWYFESYNKDLAAETDGEAKYVDIPFADTADYPAWYGRSAPFGYTQRMYVMSSKCEHPEKAVELLNWIYSVEGSRTIFNGVKGMTWDDIDGKAQLMPDVLDKINNDSAYTLEMGIGKYKGMVGQDYDAVDPATGIHIDLMQESDVIKAGMTAADKAYAEHYNAEIPLDVIGNRENKTDSTLAYEALMPVDVPTDISRAVTKIENYLMQELAVLVKAETDEAYQAKVEEIREELKAMDYDTVRDFYKEAFDDAQTKYEEYKGN